jgi:sulfate permease, SulP family
MPLSCPADDISLRPLKKDLANYSFETLRQDLSAGLSVALLTVPQAMAYALLAGLPLYCGLFASIYSAIVAALLGSSRHLVVGASNALAILIQAGTADILYTYYRDLTAFERDIMAVQVLTQLTFLCALLQIMAAWCRLGRLTQFVSHSVVIGYIAGAALAMVINQLFVFLGMPRPPGGHSSYENAVYLISHINLIEWPTTIVGLSSLALLLVLKRLNKNIPAAVIAFAVAGIAVELLGLSSYSASSWLADHYLDDHVLPNVMVIGDTGEIYEVMPSLEIPFFNMRIMNSVLPMACAIALLSMMESSSVAKSIAANSGQRLGLNQELFGIGMGNLVSAFTGAMPVSGSPSRSGLNYSSGAKTRFASIFNSIFVALIVFALGFIVTRIPLTALSALLLYTAANIVNTKQLMLCLRATRADAFVLWTTLLSCIFFSLDMAFYIGVGLSVILYLKKASIPQLMEYDINDAGDLKNLDPAAIQQHKTIRVIKVDGELFFGAADLFQTTLKTLAEDDTSTRVIILQLKNARDIDATVCLALQRLLEYLKGSGRYLVACGLTPHIWEVLCSSGLADEIGRENLFLFDENHPHQHMQRAYLWAKELANRVPEQIPVPMPVSEPVPELN